MTRRASAQREMISDRRRGTPRQCVRAEDVRVGDFILTPYKPRTWQRVTARSAERSTDPWQRSIRVDTGTDRTWWRRQDLVSIKRG
jgi:hypothetical protein